MKKYLELRGELAKRGYTFKDMAIAIHRSYIYVCKWACGEGHIRLAEAYRALDWMELPHCDISRVFPREDKS